MRNARCGTRRPGGGRRGTVEAGRSVVPAESNVARNGDSVAMLKKTIRIVPAVGLVGLVLARLFRRRHEPEQKPFFRRLVTH